ncbi:MAG: ABC transporter ATP-binding protein [Phycisphaerales bacterium JB050]
MLRLHEVRKSYGSVEALRGVTLAVRPGEVLSLLGPNGAGKSTTIGIATGLMAPDAGRVEIAGVGDPRLGAVRAHLGVAPQDLALYEDLTALENLRFFGRLYRLERSVIESRSEALLEEFGLASRARDRVSTYSGGMKRRLNLAVALIHDPPLVLMDEPTAGVDPHSRSAILGYVQRLGEAGKAVVYSTHYMEEAQRISDRVAILDHGEVIASGSVEEIIKAHGGVTRVRQELPGEVRAVQSDEPLVTLSEMLADERTLAVHIDRPDLEGVFLNLTGRSLRDR